MSTSPFISKTLHAHVYMHTHIKAISAIFVTLFRKSWKLFASLGVVCLPPAPHSTAERCRHFSVRFYRMHCRERAAPSQRYWRKASYSPALEKRLLCSYYKCFQLLSWFTWKYSETSVSRQWLGEGYCLLLRWGHGGRNRGLFLFNFCFINPPHL